MKRVAPILVAIAVLGGLVVMFFAAATLVPTDVEKLANQHPPVDDRTRRSPKRGCGLTEVVVEDRCVAAKTSSVRQEQVRFPRTTRAGPRELAGTLTIPVGVEGKRPAVVLVHGSGPQTRDEAVPGDLVTRLAEPLPVFSQLAEHLAKQGVVVLRYDKRACVPCYAEIGWEPSFEEYWKQFSFLHFIDDAQAALAYLAAREDVDANALVVIGHSEGAALAPAIANGRVRAVVMMAGFTESFGDVLLGQLQRFAEIREDQFDVIGAWSVRRMRNKLAECFENLDDSDRVCIGGGVTQRALKEYEAWSRGTPARLRALDVPWMAVQGTVDRNVFAEEIDVMRRLDVKDAEFHLVQDVAHTLANAIEPTSPPTIDREVLGRIDRFLGSVSR